MSVPEKIKCIQMTSDTAYTVPESKGVGRKIFRGGVNGKKTEK